jgi:hypothetical protein
MYLNNCNKLRFMKFKHLNTIVYMKLLTCAVIAASCSVKVALALLADSLNTLVNVSACRCQCPTLKCKHCEIGDCRRHVKLQHSLCYTCHCETRKCTRLKFSTHSSLLCSVDSSSFRRATSSLVIDTAASMLAMTVSLLAIAASFSRNLCSNTSVAAHRTVAAMISYVHIISPSTYTRLQCL